MKEKISSKKETIHCPICGVASCEHRSRYSTAFMEDVSKFGIDRLLNRLEAGKDRNEVAVILEKPREKSA